MNAPKSGRFDASSEIGTFFQHAERALPPGFQQKNTA